MMKGWDCFSAEILKLTATQKQVRKEPVELWRRRLAGGLALWSDDKSRRRDAGATKTLRLVVYRTVMYHMC